MERPKMNVLKSFYTEEDGATAVEYGIMVAAIAAVIITIVIAVGSRTDSAFADVESAMGSL